MLINKRVIRVPSRGFAGNLFEQVLYVQGPREGADVAPANTKKARGMRRGLGKNRINYA